MYENVKKYNIRACCVKRSLIADTAWTQKTSADPDRPGLL